MFTGIIQAKGRITRTQPNPFGMRLFVDPDGWDYRPNLGDSVAVNGVCLTYAPTPGERTLAFDVIRETLEHSTIGRLKAGDAVNLEAALTPNTRLGGHFVQGHVDGLGKLFRIDKGPEEVRITVEHSPDLTPYIVPKGSVTIDGISLTVAETEPDAGRFTVALIPTTLDLTTLGEAKVGDAVNLETDMIARTVVHWMQTVLGRSGGGLTLDKLREAGFLP